MFKRVPAIAFLNIAALTFLLAGQANACLGPQMEDHHYPSCHIPEPNDNELVTVVSAGMGRSPSASVHVGEPTKATDFITIDIAPNEEKHYLILQSINQAIWNIEGDTDSVSRVVVLGATGLGPWAAGVIGIPKDRVTYTSPDLNALDTVGFTSCTRVKTSCTAMQWFGQPRTDKVFFHPPPKQQSIQLDAYIGVGMDFSLPDGRDPRPGPDWPVSLRTAYPTNETVVVDPAAVVAPRDAVPYDQKTGRAGLDDLVKSGALFAAGSPEHNESVRLYAELFSARYRTRFDPDYFFLPQVDYVVTRPIKLPADIRAGIFLLDADVPLPDMNGNNSYPICFLAMDRATEPTARSDYNSLYCRENSSGMRKPDNAVFYAAQYADSLELGDDCRQAALPTGAKIIVLNVFETGRKRYMNDPLREIEVKVTGVDPVVLYVQTSGGPAQWTIEGDQVKQVFQARPQINSRSKLTLNRAPSDLTRLGIDKDDCPYFAPYELDLRGPTYLHLDQMVKTLLGHPIDQLIETQLTGTEPIQIEIK